MNNNKKYCKRQNCRYWISNLKNKNCALVTADQSTNMTLEEVGNIFNVTRMRICQIEKKAINKIKSLFNSKSN
jgi:DNA-directed RNA polymerase sigma subunit (sigma70/sigma32)